jgi:membrane-bound metal-dependent hydrolase YbcI (DUF457 family)
MGTLAPGSDRALRGWCVAAAVAPDVDAVSYLFGDVAYSRYHHTFGHNVFLGAALVAAVAWAERRRGPRRWLAFTALVALAFASHLLADAKLSAYPIEPFWPLSRAAFEFHPNLGLAAPINTWLVYASLATMILLAGWKRVSPLDLISPHLDRRVRRAVSPRRLACGHCGRPCSDRCDSCAAPVCARDGRIGAGFRLSCPRCFAEARTG